MDSAVCTFIKSGRIECKKLNEGYPDVPILNPMNKEDLEFLAKNEELSETEKSAVYSGTFKNKKVVIKHIKKHNKYGQDVYTLENLHDDVGFQNYTSCYGLSPKIHGYYECKHGFVIIMDYVDGKNIKDMIVEYSKMKIDSDKEAFFIVKSYLKMVYLSLFMNRKLGILHGDFHTDNVIVTHENDFLVLDFEYTERYPDYNCMFNMVRNLKRMEFSGLGFMLSDIFSDIMNVSRSFNLTYYLLMEDENFKFGNDILETLSNVIKSKKLDDLDYLVGILSQNLGKNGKLLMGDEIFLFFRDTILNEFSIKYNFGIEYLSKIVDDFSFPNNF